MFKSEAEQERKVFFALGESTRLEIISMLRDEGEMRISDIAQSFDLSRQAITQHLDLLIEAGILTDSRVGRERFFKLESNAFDPIQEWLSEYEQFWTDKLASLKNKIERREKK